jgi:hypothetical protein
MKNKTKSSKISVVSISSPSNESQVCGVKYVDVVINYSNGAELKDTYRKSEYELRKFYLDILINKYKIEESELELLRKLISEECSQKELENQID